MTSSFIIWIILLFTWVHIKEGHTITSLGFARTGSLHQVLIEAITGIGLTSLVVGINLMLGNADLGSFQAIALGPVIILLIGFIIQGSAEEIAYRSYLIQAMFPKWPITAVIITQAILFTAGHVGNNLNPIAIVTMLTVSYFLAMWVLATGSLWGL